ncbi:MAG: DUF4293 domain-containing protein [Bacteroidaceae bacterium]|nr:DUF4293 domain-containing protein [Bacteroidaceae bacterium]
MIQRIQTVYLALTALLCGVSLCSTIGRFANETDIVASFTNFVFRPAEESSLDLIGPWPFGVLLIVILLLNVMSIFLFNYRMRQLRLVVFSTILLVGYLAAYAFIVWFYLQQLAHANVAAHYELAHGAIYPLVCIILNVLAIRGIRKDEALVRSLDRIR